MSNFDWSVISALSDFLAAIAVVASLLYLAIQVRDSKNATRSATHFQVTESLNQQFFNLVQDPALFRIYKLGNQNPAQLSSDEFARYMALVGGIFARYNNYYLQYANGTLAEEPWHIAVEHMRGMMRFPGIQLWWSKSRGLYLQDMREVLDGIAREYQ